MQGIIYAVVCSIVSFTVLWLYSAKVSTGQAFFPPAMSIALWVVSIIPTASASIWLTKAQDRQQRYESDLRSAHNSVVTHSESIAFYGGERSELDNLEAKRNSIGSNLKKFAAAKMLIDVLQMFFRQLVKFYSVLLYGIFVTNVRNENPSATSNPQLLTPIIRATETLIKGLMDCTKQMLDFAKCVAFNDRVTRIHEVM